MKKILSIALCLVLVFGIVTAAAVSTSAVDTAEKDVLSDTLAETGAEENADSLIDVGAEAELADSGAVTPVNLGKSFYARVRMVKFSDYYLTVPASETNTPILRKLNNYNSQVWHFTLDGKTYRIRNVATDRYLEMSGSDVKEGVSLYHSTMKNAAEQKWIISKDATGYRIHSSVDDGYVMVCVNPTASTSRVVLTTAVTNARAYFTIEKLAITSDLLETPTVRLVNQVGGVLVDWNNVPNAARYRCYRYNDSTKKWVALADTAKSYYVDTTVTSGVTYRYTVKTISPVLSGTQVKSITYVAAPEPYVNNTANGPQIQWKKVAGAAKYRVFIHNGTGWKTLATTDTNSYLHTNFEYNKEYKYTVRCMAEDGKTFISAYDTNGVTNKIVKTPAVKASIMPFSYLLSWDKVTGASKYRVYCKTKATDMKWAEAGDTAENSFNFSDVVSNTGYYFAVRALDAKGKLISGFQSTKLMTFFDAPCIYDVTTTSNTRKLSWYPVDGAAQYRVFAWNGKKWVNKGDTPSYTTVFSAAITGTEEQNVCYAVRCMDKDGNYISYYLETVLEADLRYYYPGEYTSTHKF